MVNPQIEESWKAALSDTFQQPFMQNIKAFIKEEKAKGKTVFPPSNLIFNAFNLTPFQNVKVVIIGQDPYHGYGQAHGLSFSVPEGINPPPSLLNIFKELQTDVGISLPNHGNLESWAKQGVLLLNAVLTVNQSEAASHKAAGWERFTDEVIHTLSKQREHLVFLLWGNFAKEKARLIDKQKHLILTAGHPSPLSVRSFLGCRHFSQANQWLTAHQLTPINWQI